MDLSYSIKLEPVYQFESKKGIGPTKMLCICKRQCDLSPLNYVPMKGNLIKVSDAIIPRS